MEYRNPNNLTPHPISIQLYGENQIEDILESIREYGILTPLTITANNKIISGHRRWHSAIELQLETIPVEVKAYENEWAEKRAILEFNRQREKTFSQKMNEAKLLKEIEVEQAKGRESFGGQGVEILPHLQGKTRDKVAKQVGLGSGKTYTKAEKIWGKAEKGDEQAQELIKDLDSGEKTINRAFRELEATEKRQAFVESKQELPAGTFDVFYADPPWQYEFSEVSREIEGQYPTMTLQELKDFGLQIDEHIANPAVLFLWATAPKLLEAIEVMKEWGFSYKTNAVWDKEKIGMGYWFRGQHELLLVGTQGNYLPPSTEARFSSVIKEPRSDHSAKPECVYDMIEAICPSSKYLELFSRKSREGWESWGNQSI